MRSSKIKIATMTQHELDAVLAHDPVVLVPMGSLENQGPMTITGDYLLADAIAERVATKTSISGIATIVTPVIPFGCADYFSGTRGGIALSPSTFRLVVKEVLEPLVGSGARKIVILNGHGGNVVPIHEVTQAIYERDGILIPSLYLWKVAFMCMAKELGVEKAAAIGGHGASPLSSVALHLFPDEMRPDLAEPPQPLKDVLGLEATGFGTARFQGAEINIPVSVHAISTNGVVGGDMRACSAELGMTLTDYLVALMADFVKHLDEQG